MDEHLLFDFKTDISGMAIPEKLNNPFGSFIPEIARIAAKELQEFIIIESQNWEHDFSIHRGKMFGVLVVQKEVNHRNSHQIIQEKSEIPNLLIFPTYQPFLQLNSLLD